MLCPPELDLVTRVSRPCICLCTGGIGASAPCLAAVPVVCDTTRLQLGSTTTLALLFLSIPHRRTSKFFSEAMADVLNADDNQTGTPRAALLSGACPPRHAATARPHPAYPSVHMAPPQPASAPRPQPCAHGVGRVIWSGAGMREPHHSHPSRDGSQKGGPVPRPSLTLTPPSAGLSAFDGKAG